MYKQYKNTNKGDKTPTIYPDYNFGHYKNIEKMLWLISIKRFKWITKPIYLVYFY